MASDPSKPPSPASDITLALRAPQAAKALGISPRLLATLTAEGRVPFVRINRAVVYPVPELQRWLSDQARLCYDDAERGGRKLLNGGAE